MSTAAQSAANAANAQHSTGPVTDAGKAKSSRNALKHGLTATTILLPGEDEAAYRTLCDETAQYWKPAHAQEKGLVQILCDAQWRIARCARIEAAIFAEDIPDFKAFDILSKHESRLKKQYTSTLKELQGLVTARLAQEEARMKQAVLIRRADRMDNKDYDLRDIGFDFSNEQIDAVIRLQNLLIGAQKIVALGRKKVNVQDYGVKSQKEA